MIYLNFDLFDIDESLQYLLIKGVPFTIVKSRKYFKSGDTHPTYASYWIMVDTDIVNVKITDSKLGGPPKWVLKAKDEKIVNNVKALLDTIGDKK